MKAIRVKVIRSNCSECRDALLSDCRRFHLPVPTDQCILIPERWASHKCPHKQDGFVLEFEETVTVELDLPAESARWKGEEEIEDPAWGNNLDATKGIGYPAREDGKYGSHPSHDGFDDESQS